MHAACLIKKANIQEQDFFLILGLCTRSLCERSDSSAVSSCLHALDNLVRWLILLFRFYIMRFCVVIFCILRHGGCAIVCRANECPQSHVAYTGLFLKYVFSFCVYTNDHDGVIFQAVDEQMLVMKLVLHLTTGTHKPSDSGGLIPGSCMIYAVLEVLGFDS